MPSPHPAVTPTAIVIALKYGKNVSRGILEMEAELSWANDPATFPTFKQRQLIAWFWKNKPEMVREIVCEECPEHGEEMK